jgi:hypothetical protein
MGAVAKNSLIWQLILLQYISAERANWYVGQPYCRLYICGWIGDVENAHSHLKSKPHSKSMLDDAFIMTEERAIKENLKHKELCYRRGPLHSKWRTRSTMSSGELEEAADNCWRYEVTKDISQFMRQQPSFPGADNDIPSQCIEEAKRKVPGN